MNAHIGKSGLAGLWQLRWLRYSVFALGGLAVLGLVGIAAIVVYFIRITADVPAIEDLAQYEPPVMTRVHAGDGTLIAEYAQESRVFVPYETIPEPIIQAFIAAEDQNFFSHDGVDYMAIAKAQVRNVMNCFRGGCTTQGGSTITQQVAKNFKFTFEQTLERKAKEAVVARRIEKAFTKEKILELYLNEIFMGNRAYGVAAASLLYFGKPLDEVTLSEAAYLAALVKGPSNYHPERHKARAIGRRNWVLSRMEEEGFITAEERDLAQQDDLVTVERLVGNTYRAADYFVEEVRRDVFNMYGEEELYQGGLSIRTTLDPQLQVAARDALRKGLVRFDRSYDYRGPLATLSVEGSWSEALAAFEPETRIEDWTLALVRRGSAEAVTLGLLDGSETALAAEDARWAAQSGQTLKEGDVVFVERVGEALRLRQIPEVQGGLIAMDPYTGRVLAMMGGFSFNTSQFNRVTQARRQPGSAFKPFVYAAALDAGKTPVDKVLDAPYVSMTNTDGTFYKPENFTNLWYGDSTLRLGVEKSRNAMTVRLANEIGLDKVSDIGERLGIYDNLPRFESMSLGAGETTLWRLAAAYAQLINGGRAVTPAIIDRVQDRDGVTVYKVERRECVGCTVSDISTAREPTLIDNRPVTMDPVTAYQVVSMLEGVIERGTGASLKRVGRTIGGKTGTTNDFKDAWFVGFSPNLVVGVYVGYDTPATLGDGESGGTAAAPIFGDFMMSALADQPDVPFRIPPGVRLVPVDAVTGNLAAFDDPSAILEAFRPGTEPTTFALSDDDGGFADFAPDDDGITFSRPGDRDDEAGDTWLYPQEQADGGPDGGAEGRSGDFGMRGADGLDRSGLQSIILRENDRARGDGTSAVDPLRPVAASDADEGEGEEEGERLEGLY